MPGPLDRQPTKLDYASPTQFRFGIHQLPKVEYFVTACTLPAISLDSATLATPFKDIPITGEKLAYSPLEVTFIVDEYLENYITLHQWITGIGFPQNRKQFTTFRDTTSNTPANSTGEQPVDRVGNTTPDTAMYSDGYPVCQIHSNLDKNDRQKSYEQFRSGATRVLISSNVTARGIDIQQVSTVINFDIPKCINTYLHRIGRSGRWGRKGTAINFITRRDYRLLKEIESFYSTSISELPSNYNESK